MQQFSITAFAGSINNEEVTLINGEDLHAALGIKTRYSNWILRRIEEFGFVRNLDFIGVSKIGRTEAGFFGQREIETTEYHLTLDMAKELAMVERSEIGRQVRKRNPRRDPCVGIVTNGADAGAVVGGADLGLARQCVFTAVGALFAGRFVTGGNGEAVGLFGDQGGAGTAFVA